MVLYRLIEHSSSPMNYGFSIQPNEGGRLDKCFIDLSSIDSLNRIVMGPLKSYQDKIGRASCRERVSPPV